MTNSIGDRFQKETRYTRGKLPRGCLDREAKPSLYKEYKDKEKIVLPAPDLDPSLSLKNILKKRKSIRHFSSAALNLKQISYLTWASTGIRQKLRGYEFRTAPSAGALYPIETYLVANRIDKMEIGIYHYNIKIHQLELLKKGDFGDVTSKAALEQDMCSQAPVVFIWTAVFARSKWKYRERAFRYIYLDAGHIAENLALATTALDLGSCQIAALFDDEANQILDVDGENESVIYMSVVGHPI